MCFDTSANWYASVANYKEGQASNSSRCCECGNVIAAGEWRQNIYMQEHEECQRCEWEELADGDEPCQDHDYGEIFEGDVCHVCYKMREAIKAVEIDEGCAEWESQPLIGELGDAMAERELAAKYLPRAIKMFPADAHLFAKYGV